MLCSLLTVLLLVSCFAGTVNAAGRASGKFDITVMAGELKPARTGFPMAAGETVTINAAYSPSSADVDFGLVDKNGTFYHAKGENGAFNDIYVCGEKQFRCKCKCYRVRKVLTMQQ